MIVSERYLSVLDIDLASYPANVFGNLARRRDIHRWRRYRIMYLVLSRRMPPMKERIESRSESGDMDSKWLWDKVNQ